MKSYIICLVILGIGIQTAFAQQGPEQRAKLQQRIESQRIAFITQKLDLSPDESAKFWPVYNEYKKVQKAKKKEIVPDKPLNKLTNDEAENVIEDYLALDEEMIELKRDYIKKLKEIIPPTKIVLLVQVEMEFNRVVLEKLRQRQGQGQGRSRGN
jgi:hypothetical protein